MQALSTYILLFSLWLVLGSVNGFEGAPRSPNKYVLSQSMSVISKLVATVPLAVLLAPEQSAIAEILNDDALIDAAAGFVAEVQQKRGLLSDEFEISFGEGPLGLGFVQVDRMGFPVSTVSSIKDPKLARANPKLREGAVVTRVAEEVVDGQPLMEIASIIQKQPRPVTIRFRDPSRYFEMLDSSVPGAVTPKITTSYLPANADKGKAEEIIVVERLAMPPADQRARSAVMLDVLEIQYAARVMDRDGASLGGVVDSSAERSPPGSSGKTIYYVLGQQNGPAGDKMPQGFDVTLRGMVVGEKRRVRLPPSLAYGMKGIKKRGIPSYATLIYDVKLVSIT